MQSFETLTTLDMMRGLCFRITRSLVIIINLIITALACLFIYVSFNAFTQDYELDTISNESGQPKLVHTYVSIICAGLGFIIALLALLGLIGAIRNSKSILGTYAIIIFFMVSFLFILVIYTYTINTTPGNSLAYKDIDKSYVNSTVVVYNYVDPSDMKTRIIDHLQKRFSCCGVNSPNDWTEYSLHKIPRSCCSDPVESSLPVFKYCAESDHKIGCWKALIDHFHANLASVRIILYTLIIFGLICTAKACFMIKTLRSRLDVV